MYAQTKKDSLSFEIEKYNESKAERIDESKLKRQKIEQDHEVALNNSKKDIILALLNQGKTGIEIAEFLKQMGY